MIYRPEIEDMPEVDPSGNAKPKASAKARRESTATHIFQALFTILAVSLLVWGIVSIWRQIL